jgi:hypothetical protein
VVIFLSPDKIVGAVEIFLTDIVVGETFLSKGQFSRGE